MVFLVDDDIDDLEMVKEALHRNNFTRDIFMIENGKELMSRLTEPLTPLPELILLDLNMPFKNGFEVLHEMKRLDTLVQIPVIVLTASSSNEDEMRCRQLGCDLYLSKPHTYDGYEKLGSTVINFINNLRTR